jgi:hypothetical protein
MAGLPGTEAAALTLKLKNSSHLQAAVWTLMINWGRRDPAAATTWAAEHLPPAALKHAMECFESNVISSTSRESAAAVMAGLTPAAWLALETHIGIGEAQTYLAGAPDWMLARLYPKLPGSTASLTAWAEPGKAPDWFQALPAEQAAEVVENFAARETGRGKRPLASSVPPQWQESAARGIVERLARDGVPAAEQPALPPEERTLLRAQLAGLDPAAPHGEALQRWLE